MEWKKRGEVCSIRLKTKFKEKDICMYLVREKRENHHHNNHNTHTHTRWPSLQKQISTTEISTTNELRFTQVE